MPLTVYLLDQPIHAWDYANLDDWQRLRDSRGSVGRLRFPCCSSPVVLKVSSNAMPFFAHAPGQACALSQSQGHRESPEHRALKYAVAVHLSRLDGWTVVTEHPAPDGTWRADVLASHTDGRRLAVEPQLSHQSAQAFFSRSRRYVDAGILPAWITTGLPAEIEMRSVAHFQIPGRYVLRVPVENILNTDGETVQWGDSQTLTLAQYLDRMASAGAEWPWRLQATTSLNVKPPKPRVQWPDPGPPPATEQERIRRLYARLVEAARLDQGR